MRTEPLAHLGTAHADGDCMADVIVLGASADGIQSIGEILHGLPDDFAMPVLVVQHLGRRSSGLLPSILARQTPRRVVHPVPGDVLVPGVVYVAPPARHMLLRGSRILLSDGPEENYSRPAVDALFRSAAVSFGGGAIGVVLTGYLSDGTAGIAAIHDRGGVAIVQNPATAGAPQMPSSVLARVPVDYVCQLSDIPPLLVQLSRASRPTAAMPPYIEVEDRIAGNEATAGELASILVGAAAIRRPCPLCHREMFRLTEENRFEHLRCSSGHAFTDVTTDHAASAPTDRSTT